MKIAIRADAALHIGTGHVMRCIALASALKEKGAHLLFICRDHPGHLEDFIKLKGFDIVLLASAKDAKNDNLEKQTNNYPEHLNWLGVSPKLDAEQTIKSMNGQTYDWLIIDHYAIEKSWEIELRSCVRNILVIDDLADREHDCDLLLDQNIPISASHHYENLVKPKTRQLRGPQYCLLRPEFAGAFNQLKSIKAPKQSLLVFFGGVDEFGLTLEVLETLSSFKGLKITAVVGKNNPLKALIQEKCQKNNFAFLYNVSNMAEIMANSEYALIACGFACYELAALNIPAVHVPLSEIQEKVALRLEEIGVGVMLDRKHLNNRDLLVAKLDALKGISKKAFKGFDLDGITKVVNEIV
jgi:UDP-2,4-diacetamido-2,4,6-trideoxy-beta-L-altropyranose hydrolase